MEGSNGTSLVVEKHPLTQTSAAWSWSRITRAILRFCPSSIWVGERCEFKQHVVLSYEHDPEQLYVGWAINGSTVFDPGLSAGTRPEGDPVLGAAGLAMLWPYEGYGHKAIVRLQFVDRRPSAFQA